MRNIDKAILLAEFLKVDVSQYLPDFVSKLLVSPQYLQLQSLMKKLKESKSSIPDELVVAYEKIKINEIDTIQDAMIAYGNINYCLRLVQNGYLINPLLYNPQVKIINQIGDILIDFDGKNKTLNEVITIDGYTNRYKLQAIKSTLEYWKKDLNDKVLDPLYRVNLKTKNLPERHIFNYFVMTELVMTIIFDLGILFFLFSPFKISQDFNQLLLNPILQYIGYAIIGIVSLLNIHLFATIHSRRRKLTKYILARKKAFAHPNKILISCNKAYADVHQEILRALIERRPATREVKSFKNFLAMQRYLEFLEAINHRRGDDKISEEEGSSISMLLTGLTIIGIIAFAVIFFLIQGGIIK